MKKELQSLNNEVMKANLNGKGICQSITFLKESDTYAVTTFNQITGKFIGQTCYFDIKGKEMKISYGIQKLINQIKNEQ